jgi:hypothetical protein
MFAVAANVSDCSGRSEGTGRSHVLPPESKGEYDWLREKVTLQGKERDCRKSWAIPVDVHSNPL